MVIGSIDDKSKFGDTANIFEGINEGDLQEKLNETMKDLTGFFNDMSENNESDSSGNAGEFKFDASENAIPNIEGIHEHLKGEFSMVKLGN